MAIKTINYNQNSFDISYEMLNVDAEVDLIILHGWGSNKNLMKSSFLPYMKGFRHIYIDLPGFGKSSNPISLTTQDYAEILEIFLAQIGASKDIILGHSFGGKVALLLSPKFLVLVGSAGIKIPKPLGVRVKIALFKLLKLFGLAKFRSLFIAQDAQNLSEHMYQTFKNVVDEDFSDKFASFEQKALLCWGKDDTATPLESAKKIDALMKDSTLRVYDGDHYFFMQKAKEISGEIEDIFLKKLGNR
jgi:pimeloyl-ACP methyl ester carboxylesterase